MKFSIKDFFSKCETAEIFFRKMQIWSPLLKKFLMENFVFCAVYLVEDIFTIRLRSGIRFTESRCTWLPKINLIMIGNIVSLISLWEKMRCHNHQIMLLKHLFILKNWLWIFKLKRVELLFLPNVAKTKPFRLPPPGKRLKVAACVTAFPLSQTREWYYDKSLVNFNMKYLY